MKRICFSLCVVFFFTAAYAQNTIPKAQTLFIYNFALLTEWPQQYRNGPFIIGVIGESDIFNELKSYTADKRVGSQQIKVMQFDSAEEITTCHMLFIPFSQTRLISKINTHLNGNSTLLITEKNGALNAGSAINFIIIQEKMKFEISIENANKNGIRISSELQEMAALTI